MSEDKSAENMNELSRMVKELVDLKLGSEESYQRKLKATKEVVADMKPIFAELYSALTGDILKSLMKVLEDKE